MLTAAKQEIRDRLEVGPVCCLENLYNAYILIGNISFLL